MIEGAIKGTITSVKYDGPMQTVTIETLDGNTRNELEALWPFGFVAGAKSGMECLALSPMNDPSQMIVISIWDRSNRFEVGPDDAAVYDGRGQSMHLAPDGLHIKAKNIFMEKA